MKKHKTIYYFEFISDYKYDKISPEYYQMTPVDKYPVIMGILKWSMDELTDNVNNMQLDNEGGKR